MNLKLRNCRFSVASKPSRYLVLVVVSILGFSVAQYCPKSHLTSKISTRAVCYYQDKQVPCNDRILPNTRALLSCAIGYTAPFEHQGIAKRKFITCRSDGTWDFELYSCEMQCGKVDKQQEDNIRNNDDVTISDVPWHVGVYNIKYGVSSSHICSGTILTPNLIITAAHCFWDTSREAPHPRDYRIIAGKNFREYDSIDEPLPVQRRNVSRIFMPNDYLGKTRKYEYDIAIVKLTLPFKFTTSIQPICMEFFNWRDREIERNFYGDLAGWSTADDQQVPSDKLQTVRYNTLEYDKCEEKLRSIHSFYSLPRVKFCAYDQYGIIACRGDSGSGFVGSVIGTDGQQTYNLLGVLSYGAGKSDCVQSGVVIMENVQLMRNFIEPLMNASLNELAIVADK